MNVNLGFIQHKKECCDKLNMNEPHLTSVLATLSVIVKLCPNVFFPNANAVKIFVLESLLPFTPAKHKCVENSNSEQNITKRDWLKNEWVKQTNNLKKTCKETTCGKEAWGCNSSLIVQSKKLGMDVLTLYLLALALAQKKQSEDQLARARQRDRAKSTNPDGAERTYTRFLLLFLKKKKK
ncbi:hypothetical protein RFI_16221 [Reticulomyxa filosa]|uniref:Uncharacterized protein n=1 Tax=Reticulomyxa filosa TaxID=46433 RepID=X6N4P5_RETFI|nr:hypothetical protein RFI_16221 [Reticulomyxa filosa]|eukprot:ETO20986.1 hypothetical protein RFI_16221 [Reticulomyxa filosa]